MAQSILSVRMDSDTKAAFSAFCDEVGMSLSTAITIFAKQTVREQRLPFSITSAKRQTDGVTQGESLTLGALKAAVVAAASESPSIQRVVLFGSYARGEARVDSDIDLRVICDENAGMFALGGFASRVREKTGKEVDIVSKDDLGDSDVAREINRDGVVLFER